MSDLDMLSGSAPAHEKIQKLQDFKTSLDDTVDVDARSAQQVRALPKLLEVLSPTTTAEKLEEMHAMRLSALEILQRFHFNDALKEHASAILNMIFDVLRRDNEENACVCLKIFIDLHKAYKAHIETFVQPFLEIVLQIYRAIPEYIKQINEDDEPSTVQQVTGSVQSPSSSSNSTAAPRASTLRPARSSCKVLTECPIIIVLLFSSYRSIVQSNLAQFTPAIIEMLSLQLDNRGKSIEATSLYSKIIRGELLLAQIKTLSFLAYILRGFTTYMKKYMNVIPNFVLKLLQDCPPDMSAARKVAIMKISLIVGTPSSSPPHFIY